MIPKIIFTNSRVYDWVIYFFSTGKLPDEKLNKLLEKREIYCKNKIKKIEKWWKTTDKKVLNLMPNLTGIPWKKKEIQFYFLKSPQRKITVGGWSEPLSIFFEKYLNKKGKNAVPENKLTTMTDTWLKNTIIHEILHYNLSGDEIKEYGKKLKRKYECDDLTKDHILVHAILKETYSQILNDKHLKENVDYDSLHPSYKRSWDIVNKEGHKIIIADWRNHLKKYKSR